MNLANLTEVDAIRVVAGNGSLRHCDVCHESACEYIWNSRPLKKFFMSTEETGSLTVCEHCVDKFQEDDE